MHTRIYVFLVVSLGVLGIAHRVESAQKLYVGHSVRDQGIVASYVRGLVPSSETTQKYFLRCRMEHVYEFVLDSASVIESGCHALIDVPNSIATIGVSSGTCVASGPDGFKVDAAPGFVHIREGDWISFLPRVSVLLENETNNARVSNYTLFLSDTIGVDLASHVSGKLEKNENYPLVPILEQGCGNKTLTNWYTCLKIGDSLEVVSASDTTLLKIPFTPYLRMASSFRPIPSRGIIVMDYSFCYNGRSYVVPGWSVFSDDIGTLCRIENFLTR